MEELPHGLGAILALGGILQIFLQTFYVIKERNGKLRSTFRLRRPSSIYPGLIMILIGAALLIFVPYGTPYY